MEDKRFKDIERKRYWQIKQEHGDDYVHAYREALAEVNELVGSYLYTKLKPLKKSKGKSYIVAVMDGNYKCVHVGHTESPFDYWIDILRKNRFGSVKDIEILEKDLDYSLAPKKAKDMKGNMLQITQSLRIKLALS